MFIKTYGIKSLIIQNVDTSPHEIINGPLDKRGIEPMISRWMAEVLYTRTAKTYAGNKTISVRECPQGGIL